MNDEIKEGKVLNWSYVDYGTEYPAVRRRTYIIEFLDGRIIPVTEEKLLECAIGDSVLVILPHGNITQAYLSEKRTSGSTSTIPTSDEYLEIHKML